MAAAGARATRDEKSVKTVFDLKLLVDTYMAGPKGLIVVHGYRRSSERLRRLGCIEQDPFLRTHVRITRDGEHFVESLLKP